MKLLKNSIAAITLLALSCAQAAIIDITTKEQFEAIKNDAAKNIIIDFYTDWCSYCTLIKVPFEELSEQAEYASITFARVNTDQLPDVAKELGVEDLPTIIFFKDGKQVDKIRGAKTAASFKESVQVAIANQYAIAATPTKTDAPSAIPAQTESACPFCLKVWAVVKSWLIFILDGLAKIIAYLRSLLA